ncbi:GDYXXLXY domain-containing protein [Hyphomicrobium sp. CS1GBMeth3]|uniref:GDYXXLXY domain-containing protein n=1 Tax=Hyphomicrobium sp. CS1GBMeth3 TaxID=1892845 RepID=UPI00092FE8A8|nr:GDYXXLXY domain-containing protein [Hyphomicrobium sp. CS1GBMeth3]
MIKLSPLSWIAIAIVALVQTVALASMVYGRIALLRDGREIVAEVIPVDPRDLFRGDYVILGYAFSRTNVPVPEGVVQGDTIYVTLKETEPEKWEAQKAATHYEATANPSEVVLKGIVDYIYRPTGDAQPTASVRYGIESYFVPEGTGRELETMVRDKKISAVLAVGDTGNVAIKALVVDGKRVAVEPLL